MRKALLTIATAALLLTTGCADKKAAPTKLETMDDTLSWIMGMNIGESLANSAAFNLDEELLIAAIRSKLAGQEQPIDDTTYQGGMQYIMLLNYQMQQKRIKNQRNNADSIQNAYFTKLVSENKNVKKHPAGFYYEVLREGNGPKAQLGQRIRFDYRSYLLDGKIYDQTYERRDPIIHVVGRPMFEGLIHGFQLMNAGSLYRFYFPYQMLANEETSGSVNSFTPMIYDVELHEVYKN